jgi:hypothetical protein
MDRKSMAVEYVGAVTRNRESRRVYVHRSGERAGRATALKRDSGGVARWTTGLMATPLPTRFTCGPSAASTDRIPAATLHNGEKRQCAIAQDSVKREDVGDALEDSSR